MRRLRIFAASPSDMAPERARIEYVASLLKPLSEGLDIELKVVDWSSVVPDMGRPEQVILDQLKPTSWDVFIGILWHRFGTPTGGIDHKTGQDFFSGTEEEFEKAYLLWQNHGRPRIMMYRCKRRIPPGDLNPDQFKRVNDFFDQFDAQKGEHPGLYQTFDTTRDFERLLLGNLQRLLLEYGKDTSPAGGVEAQKPEPQRIFISYKRTTNDDRALAEYLGEYLVTKGHRVFIDTSMRIGAEWLNVIDSQIKSSHYLIVLVSKDSADSEMLQAEVLRAYEYRNSHGYPRILPVRMNYEGLLPYAISALLGTYQHAIWRTSGDNARVADEILGVINGQSQPQVVLQPPTSTPVSFSEDGRALYTGEKNSRPLYAFDPRGIVDELVEPGGSVPLGDRFYIERDSDTKLKWAISRNGETITIRASRQTGKSSLLARGIQHAHADANVVYLDLQSVEHEQLETSDHFLKCLASKITRKLRLDESVVNQIWEERLGSQDKFVKVMEELVLPKSERQIILAMDEADRLLSVPFHSDFFALMRSWHNNRAIDPLWKKLNIVMVIATEPFLLITNPNQSPFNVGINLYLEDFNREQVRELNHRHGSPVQEENLEVFFELLNGHPYLTRRALYLMVGEHWAWADLYQHAADDQGPFADHLRRQLWFILEEPTFQEALRQIITDNTCDDHKSLWRLLRGGLVKGVGDSYYCRCRLYEKYFKAHLK